MKKRFLFIILSFFLFSTSVNALENVTQVSIDVNLDKNGTANVTEEWVVGNQDNKLFTRYFREAKDLKISDIKMVDSSLSTYESAKNITEQDDHKFAYKDNRIKKYIYFTTNGESTTVTIQYKISGVITKFSDISALNWVIFSTLDNQKVDSVIINIHCGEQLTESNVALYAIGNNLSYEIKDGKINIIESFIKDKSDTRVMASINGVEFKSNVTSKKTMKEYYDYISKRSEILLIIYEFFIEKTWIAVLITLAIIGLIVLLVYFIDSLLNKDLYRRIRAYNKERELGPLQNTNYYDTIPCGGDLYKMAFYISYYNISKSRSNLIGALLIKWVLEGILEIENEKDKYQIRIKDQHQFDRELDLELYNILKDAAPNLVLDNNKLIRFAEENSERIIDWYNKSISESIRDEYLKRNVTVKKDKMYMNRVMYEDALKVQGLKRYLLNFNQVPRRTELNEQIYKYLIIASVLLGVDESFGKEILRKNPENKMAEQLLEFKNVKSLYENIYTKSLEKYNKGKHKKDKMLYNPAKKTQ